ncbi:AraC family transcriptional regulator [Leifsonia shinshuensis]|uniref:AraC family transcriptional regulator n=1 Tax=Leifsonia shinshuensis TaxID=150026 RepID=A0A7G6YEH3_9MICO|nr:AraC family transcriptional regulator [Leifsonia shinshuensis]QNE36888.1 AraC family transcriptional regulator [Leifsonia shinshuensis]
MEPRISTTDPDEASAIGARLFYGGAIHPAGRAAGFSAQLGGARVGSVALGTVSYGTRVTMVFGELKGSYGVSLPALGPLELGLGSTEVTATPDSAAVIGPIDAVRATGWGTLHDRLAHVKFEREILEAELSRMLGVDQVDEIRFPYLMDLRSGRGAEWSRLAHVLFGALDAPGGLAGNTLFSSQLSSALMTGLLLATGHQYREALESPTRPAPPATVRRATQFIDENAHLPITVPDIAAAVGVSVRTLTRGFRDHLGTSPGAYLTRARLDGAHRDLAAGRPDTTSVSQVAADWGFFNLGRFASRYRAAFGVLPSQTLRAGS